jgi:hypothetical protein
MNRRQSMACESCDFRAKYDKNPQSFLGRLWRWHAKGCPGWKKYMLSLPREERVRLAEQYDLKKFK